MVDIIRAFSFPNRYKQNLPINRIVCDQKVVEEGISHYQEKLEMGHDPKPLIVIKHPNEEMYAVLDGHHRFQAMKKMGMHRVPAVVVNAYLKPVFTLTKKGYFQPTPIVTKYVRIPFKKLTAYMKGFLENSWQLLGKE